MSHGELEPCPFCGGKARPFELTWHAGTFGSHMFEKPFWRVICGECKAAIGDFDSKAEAVEAWNTRHERTCHKVIPDEMEGYVFCSECGAEIGEYGYPNYCHNCGAKVVGE